MSQNRAGVSEHQRRLARLKSSWSHQARHGLDPASLVFEITETAAIANIERARGLATRLQSLGCRFALDDFGADFGSFYYLKHIPFD
jgi:EAL domain-containing protein (putative c-di-GMP-specific phosphodiesterase class I)